MKRQKLEGHGTSRSFLLFSTGTSLHCSFRPKTHTASSWCIKLLYQVAVSNADDRRKDVRSKIRHDPLTDINSKLDTQPKPRYTPHPPTPKDPHLARQARESSERQRALALIASRKSNAVGNWDETPSSAAGWSERIEREKDRAGHRFYPGRY